MEMDGRLRCFRGSLHEQQELLVLTSSSLCFQCWRDYSLTICSSIIVSHQPDECIVDARNVNLYGSPRTGLSSDNPTYFFSQVEL